MTAMLSLAYLRQINSNNGFSSTINNSFYIINGILCGSHSFTFNVFNVIYKQTMIELKINFSFAR